MKNTKSFRYTAVMLGCFLLLVFFSHYVGNDITVSAPQSGKKIVILDAGHGGLDSGAVGLSGTLEKEINLDIVKKLEQLLVFSGYEVVLTRSEDRSMHDDNISGIGAQKRSDMKNRLDLVKSYGSGVFFSIHQNRFSESSSKGAQMFYTSNHKDNANLAQKMQRSFQVLQPDNKRETKLAGDELYLFKNTSIPALLIECGFLSNPEEEALLNTEEYRQKVAFTIYSGLTAYMNEQKIANPIATSAPATDTSTT